MEVSSFTRQLLRDLKEQFVDGRSASSSVQKASGLLGLTAQQQQQVQTQCQTKRDALGMSMLLARNSQLPAETDTGSISDECYLFTHIVDCVKSLMEITESKRKPSQIESTPTPTKPSTTSSNSNSSILYSGFLSHIEKVIKEVLLPSSEIFADCSTSPQNDSLNRCVLTIHSLAAFPSLTQPEANSQVAKKLPLLHYAAYNAEALDLVKAVHYSNPENIRSRDKTGALPLHWAILNKQVRALGGAVSWRLVYFNMNLCECVTAFE